MEENVLKKDITIFDALIESYSDIFYNIEAAKPFCLERAEIFVAKCEEGIFKGYGDFFAEIIACLVFLTHPISNKYELDFLNILQSKYKVLKFEINAQNLKEFRVKLFDKNKEVIKKFYNSINRSSIKDEDLKQYFNELKYSFFIYVCSLVSVDCYDHCVLEEFIKEILGLDIDETEEDDDMEYESLNNKDAYGLWESIHDTILEAAFREKDSKSIIEEVKKIVISSFERGIEDSFVKYCLEQNIIDKCVNYCFENLKVVIIKNGVKDIGENAFMNCHNLNRIDIPNSVNIISNGAFEYCNNLPKIEIPDSVELIGRSAFSDCKNLKEVKIGNGVKEIGDSAFARCKKIEKVIIGDGVKEIGNNAFYWCNSLPEIEIPDSVKVIGVRAFSSCESLEKVIIGNSVKEIGEGAFASCAIEKIEIPQSVEIIGNRAFANCAIKKIEIPHSVEKIGDYAFGSCVNLIEVNISKSVRKIGKEVFSNCKNLLKIEIPDSVKDISEGAFDNCLNLKMVVIGKSVKKIGKGVFSNCKNLSKIEIPHSVEKIGDSAFYKCSNLEEITIPDSVIEIGDSAFEECKNLKTVIIGNGVKDIGRDFCKNCSKDFIIITKNPYVIEYCKKNTIIYKSSNKNDSNNESSAIKVGDIIKFGRYKQSSDKPTDISWIVLWHDEDYLLLISKYVLDAQPYSLNDGGSTWEDSDLRAWLNNVFYNSAFNKKEQDEIIASNVMAHQNSYVNYRQGNDTIDKVFVLSTKEAIKFYDVIIKENKCFYTDYAGKRLSGKNIKTKECIYWLRTRCCSGYNAFISYHGIIEESLDSFKYQFAYSKYGVRPLIRIKRQN